MATAVMEALPMPDSLPIPTATKGEDLARATYHVELKFHVLGNSKKVETDQISVVGDERDATDKTLLRVSKKLLDCPELDAIRTADAEFKKWVNGKCLPYDVGVRLIRKSLAGVFHQKAREFARKRELLVDSFLAVYQTEIDRQRTRLGPLFNVKDYAPQEWVRQQFAFSYRFLNFGVPDDLESVNKEIFDQEREKAARLMQDAAEVGQTMLLTKFAEMIDRLKTQLEPGENGKKRKLYDTAVSNLREFIANWSFVNITDYSELSAQVERANSALSSVTTEQIRESATLRSYVNREIGAIEQSLQSMVGNRTRKIRLNEIPQ